MSGVAIQFIAGWLIQPGETQHLYWTNIPAEQVYAFSLDVRPTKYQILLAPFVHQVEITRVEYRLNVPSLSGQEREIHWWIKNNGALEAIYELRMAIVFSGAAAGSTTSIKPYLAGPIGAAGDASYSFVSVQTFSPPRALVAFPVLQQVIDISLPDDVWPLEAEASITQFVDHGATQTGSFASITGTAVSKIVWSLTGRNSMNNPLRVILFLD